MPFQDWSILSENEIIAVFSFTFILSLALVFFTIPLTINFCYKYQILDHPNSIRKNHKQSIPHLGGFNIFLGLFIPFTCIAPTFSLGTFKYIFLSMFFLLVIGLWDDIRALNPWLKLLWQLFVALIIVFFSETYITNLFGLFGLDDLSTGTSYVFSVFLILTIINGINLLDGINALSASLSTMLGCFFFFWFVVIDQHGLALFACALCGTSIAFLWYNWSPAQIFMGDSGAMILGFSISYLTLSFLQTDHDLINSESKFAIFHAPNIVIAALILPFVDTTRVFLLRILKGKSPLIADRNHIHHKFIDAGFSDVQTTFILLSCQFALILIAIGTVRLPYLTSLILLSTCLLILYIGLGFVIKPEKKSSVSSPE